MAEAGSIGLCEYTPFAATTQSLACCGDLDDIVRTNDLICHPALLVNGPADNAGDGKAVREAKL